MMTEGITSLGIKSVRVERGFTQEAVAQKLGVTTKTYREWENGDVTPKPLTMYALAYLFKIDVDLLRLPDAK